MEDALAEDRERGVWGRTAELTTNAITDGQATSAEEFEPGRVEADSLEIEVDWS